MTTESGQTSGQSSSTSSGQQSAQGSVAQGGASDQGQQNQNSGQQQAATVERPAYIPEKYWDTTANTVKADDFTRDFNNLSAFKAESDVRAQGLPAGPDKYEVKLPEGFKPPEGMAFEFNADDPALAEARKAAHELKLDQNGFSRMLGIYAANKIAEQQTMTTARDAELAKLGTTGPARIDAIETWMKAKVGDKAGVMIATLKQFPIAANVEAFEGIIRAFSAQGGTSFTQQHREGEAPKGEIPGYANMSFTQRRAAQMNEKFAGSR